MEQKKIEKLIWDISAKTKIPDIPDKKNTWNNLKNLMEDSKTRINLSSKHLMKNIWSKWFFKYNYAIILTLTIVLAIPSFYKSYQNNIFKTNPGENLSFILPDNSKVILNSASTITYKKNFDVGHRTLHLEGEAYFEVKKLTSSFIVSTQYGDVTVLGTTFNVKSRNDEFEVGVNTGEVKVSNKKSFLRLSAQQCIMNKSNFNTKDIINIGYDKYPGWINQELHCNKTNLESVCKEIERIHNIKIKFSDERIKKVTITGIIDTSDLNTMLNTISILTQQTFKFEGDTYTII